MGLSVHLHSFKARSEWVIAIPAGDKLIRGLTDRSGGVAMA